jgi:hypothetical protein
MITYNFEGKQETMLSKPNEISIKLFDEIVEATNGVEEIDYYLIMFEKLGLSKNLVDRIDHGNILRLIQDWKKDMTFKKNAKIQKTIEIGGFKYNAFTGDEFKFGAKDYSLIEKYIKANVFNYTPYIMAVVYKREDLSFNEHYDNAHLKHKMSLFENTTLDIAMPVINEFGKSFTSTAKLVYGIQ